MAPTIRPICPPGVSHRIALLSPPVEFSATYTLAFREPAGCAPAYIPNPIWYQNHWSLSTTFIRGLPSWNRMQLSMNSLVRRSSR